MKMDRYGSGFRVLFWRYRLVCRPTSLRHPEMIGLLMDHDYFLIF